MAVSQSGIQLPGHLLHITPSLTIPPIFFRSRSLPRILDSLYFPGHSLAEETKKNKVGTMNTPREFEAVRDGYTRFSMAGKWVNRNEGMRNKPVSRFSRAGFFQWGQPLPNPSGDEVSIACKYQSGNNCSCVHGSCFGVCDCRGNGIGRECSKDLKAKRIRPRHLQLSIRGDEDLNTLIKGTIASGTVIPHIHRALFQNLKLSQSAGTFYY